MRSRHPQDTVLDPDDGVKSSLSVLLPTSTDQPDASHASRPRKVSSCTTTSSTCTDSGIVRNKDYVNQMSGKGDGGGGLWSTYSAKYCPPSLASYLLCNKVWNGRKTLPPNPCGFLELYWAQHFLSDDTISCIFFLRTGQLLHVAAPPQARGRQRVVTLLPHRRLPEGSWPQVARLLYRRRPRFRQGQHRHLRQNHPADRAGSAGRPASWR